MRLAAGQAALQETRTGRWDITGDDATILRLLPGGSPEEDYGVVVVGRELRLTDGVATEALRRDTSLQETHLAAAEPRQSATEAQ